MDTKFISGLMISAIAAVSLAAPASAQDYYGRDGYRQQYQDDGYGYDRDARYQEQIRQRQIERYEQQRRAQYQYDQRYGGDRGSSYYGDQNGYYADRGAYPERRTYYQGQRCRSGTTGTILGAIAGGLLGREIGRGGRYDRPSVTGLILGAGGGALAGRAIEQSGNGCR